METTEQKYRRLIARAVAGEPIIELAAEAYDINVKVEWPDEAKGVESPYKGLDFGSFKVVDEQTSSLELINEGKYEVAYKFLFKSRLVKSILRLEPLDGTLPPAENGTPSRTKVEVTFKAESEVSFRDNTDVRLRITEFRASDSLHSARSCWLY